MWLKITVQRTLSGIIGRWGLLALAGLALIIGATTYSLYQQQKQALVIAYDQQIKSIIEVIGTQSRELILSFDWPVLQQLQRDASRKPSIVQIWIEDLYSEKVFGSNATPSQSGLRLVTRDIEENGVLVGRVSAFLSTESLQRSLRRARWLASATFGTALLAVLLIAGLFARKLRASQELLTHQLNELAQQKFALDQHAIVSITDPQGSITYVNDKFCSATGYSREELIGKNHRILNSNEHSRQFFTELWQTISGGQVWKGEIKNLTRTGEACWMKSTIVPFKNEGDEVVEYVSIRTEITDWKQALTNAQHASLQAEKANRAKSDFLSSMSHELRTPLNAIIGFSQLLELDDETPLSENQRENVGYIIEGGNHLLSLINELLDLSKIDSGNTTLNMEPIPVLDSVEASIALIQAQANQKKIALTLNREVAEGEQFFADSSRMRQVLLNLLSNAIKYNHSDGSGTVEVGCDLVSEDRIRLHVRDNGCGISTEHQEKLFTPFNRLGQEGSATEGTGIGLVITRKLVEMMNGSIGVYSQAGKGSTFWIEMERAHTTEKESLSNS
ncbi:PAS domain-containing sensor histidine kinase [Marinobacterium rhizophilum]|uniref:PAS domain-containing sensor histidine kinase n=1 Tax=Marinobacterium rhizophilum TaxID=420402 RepID=UPI000368490A|nr:PAS domain-containing protein [Marinobacterium rhizophilum]